MCYLGRRQGSWEHGRERKWKERKQSCGWGLWCSRSGQKAETWCGRGPLPVATVLELLQFSWLGALASDKENQLPWGTASWAIPQARHACMDQGDRVPTEGGVTWQAAGSQVLTEARAKRWYIGYESSPAIRMKLGRAPAMERDSICCSKRRGRMTAANLHHCHCSLWGAPGWEYI